MAEVYRGRGRCGVPSEFTTLSRVTQAHLAGFCALVYHDRAYMCTMPNESITDYARQPEKSQISKTANNDRPALSLTDSYRPWNELSSAQLLSSSTRLNSSRCVFRYNSRVC